MGPILRSKQTWRWSTFDGKVGHRYSSNIYSFVSKLIHVQFCFLLHAADRLCRFRASIRMNTSHNSQLSHLFMFFRFLIFLGGSQGSGYSFLVSEQHRHLHVSTASYITRTCCPFFITITEWCSTVACSNTCNYFNCSLSSTISF